MERLFRSRMEYVSNPGPGADGCFLCRSLESEDDASVLIVKRGKVAFAVLNKFPYNTGHVMAAPKRHVGELSDLSIEERDEIMALVADIIDALRQEMEPQGFNVGMNIGLVAGAGLPDHLHMHVVPRWSGDTNFMPVVGDTKVLPETLEETYTRIRGRLSR